MATFLRVSICGVAVFVISYFLGGFSMAQSITLGVFAALFYWVLFISTETHRFVSYRVFVEPNLFNLIADLGLVTDTDEAWAEFREGIAKLPTEPSNIWKPGGGFSLSFLTPELIHVRETNQFASDDVNLFVSLEPIKIPFLKPGNDIDTDGRIGSIAPNLVVKATRLSWTLTLSVPAWFWEETREKEPFRNIPKDDVFDDYECGSVRVRLAKIPFQEFAVHNALESGRCTTEGNAKAVRARSEARAQFGWKGKSESDQYGNKPSEERSNIAEHRYCTVYHDAI
jgi:hypothetical protein